jgi:hypothetical protein
VRLEKAGHGDAFTMVHSHDASFATGCCRDDTNNVVIVRSRRNVLLVHVNTMYAGQGGNASDLQSGGARKECRLVHQQSSLRVPWLYSVSPDEC